MSKMKFESPDLTAQNIDRIAALFPNCVTEMLDEERSTKEKKVYKRAINFELLKQMLSPDVVDGDEAYEFTWVGKKAAIVEANKPIRKTLRPCIEESKNWDSTENLYIEGDNLEVLKLLQESYLGKVKMIYIDPPYNTRNDFIYADDFMRSQEEENEQMGMFDEDENRLFKNTDTNGRFHSDWCSMIYSRLMLARNLLTEDGVIFISVDDNEQENLKKMCDEVFGIQNYIGTLIRKVMEGGKSDSVGLAVEQEYCHIFGKNSSNGIYKKRSEHFEHYNKKDEYFSERGFYYLKPLENGGLGYVPTLDYPISGPNGVEIYPGDYHGDNGYRWVWGKEKFEHALALDMIAFTPSQKDKNKYKVYYKIYEKVDTDGNPLARELPFHTLYLDGYTNRQAVNDLKKLFNKTRVFDYPKPIGFLKEIVSMASKGNCIVMDFFSGSGGFAQAVMQLNAEDGGHRKFIMVQLPEKCDETSEAYKAGYKNICEIGKERIRRAGEKIKAESPTTTQDLDIGFRVLKLDDTNMKDVYYAADDYSQDMIAGLESNIKDDRTDLDLLFGCLIDWGLPLSLPYRSEQIDGCTVHTYNGGDLIACFDANIPESVVKTIAKRKPLRAVFRDSGFASSPEKINVFEIFKLYMPEDAGDITKRVRVI